MQLNDIIEENSLTTISKRTRISQENLEALVQRDWGRMKKVQALGFISILEREYHIDLSSLRNECKAYFETQAPQEHAERISVTARSVEHPGNRRGSRLLLILLMLAAAFGAWYVFVAKNSALESNATSVQSGSFYDSMIAVTSRWFGSGSRTQEAANPPAVAPLPGNDEKNGSRSDLQREQAANPAVAAESAAETKKPDGSRPSPETTQDSSAEKEPERSAQQVAGHGEKNASQPVTLKLSDLVPPESVASEENLSDTQEASSQTVSPTEPRPVSEPAVKAEPEPLAAPEPAPAKAPARPEAVKAAKKKTEAAKVPSTTTKGKEVVLNPSSKIWVGYTRLDTMKRTTEVTDKPIRFDASRHDYIVATGHGMLDLSGAGGGVQLRDGNKHYFLLSKGRVKEISHEEFQQLNKSKVW